MRVRRDGRHFTTAVKVWFLSLNKSRQIALVVLFVHFGAILWMLADHGLSAQPKRNRPIAVRTIRPEAHVPRVQTDSRQQIAKAQPAKKQAPAKQAAPAKVQKAVPKSVPITKKPLADETIRHIEQSFAALEAPVSKPATELKLPSFLESKNCKASVEEIPSNQIESTDYGLCLVDALQSALQLPEIGEVRVKITLQKPGQIAKIDILDSRSVKNAEWLKNQLPLLELPCFNDFRIADANLEFTITFRNAENP